MTAVLADISAEGFLTFVRVSGCFMLLPGFASVRVPQQVRIMLVLVLTIALFPIVGPATSIDSQMSGSRFLHFVFSETVVGAFIGLSVRIYVLAISFMATAASAAMGFSSAVVPSIAESEMEPTFATIISTASLLLLFAADFHHSVIYALVESYRLFPVNRTPDFALMADDLVAVLADSFLILFRLSSPFLAFALLAHTYVALLNKLVPSLPVYFVATPAVLIGGLAVAYYVLPMLLSFVAQGFGELVVFR